MSDRPRRLAPEDRRQQLLDVARDVVELDGAAACTVETVSQRANVTSQLVHRYFGTRIALLQELFLREADRFQAEVRANLAAASGFEDIVRVFVTANFDQLSSATAIGQLRVLPEMQSIRAERRRSGRRDAERVLVAALANEYPGTSDGTADTIEFVLRLGSAASIEAGNLSARRPRSDRSADIERAVKFILAGIRELVDTAPPHRMRNKQ